MARRNTDNRDDAERRDRTLSNGDEMLTVREAAVLGRCSRKTVLRACKKGTLTPRRRPGSHIILLRRSDVEAWVGARELEQPSEDNVVPHPSAHVRPERGPSRASFFQSHVDAALSRRRPAA